MTNSRRKSSLRRRPLLVIIILIIITLAVLGIAKIITSLSSKNNPNQESVATTVVSNREAEATTDDLFEEDGKPKIIQNEGEDPNKLESLTGVITSARVSGANAVIRVSLDQYLTSGTCSITMTNHDKIYSDTADIINSASTSTCEGFDIPVSELSSGTWSITINLSADGKTGNISGEISL